MKLILALLIANANAGWFSDWCSRKLIADDPYQFETASTDWVIREFEAHQIKANWGRLDRPAMFDILRAELERRVQYGRPEECDKVLSVLTKSLSVDLTKPKSLYGDALTCSEHPASDPGTSQN